MVLEHTPKGKLQEHWLLRKNNLGPLLELMREQGIEKLEHGEWWLTVDGHFSNPKAPAGSRSGDIRELKQPGTVFAGQNKFINPYFRGYH